MVTKNNGERVPFGIEVKIIDESGKVVYHFRPAQHNLEIGLRVTQRFVKEKLGVNINE